MSSDGTPSFVGDAASWRVIADSTYDWESWLGMEGQLLWVNPAVERMTGFTVEACFAMRDYPLPIVHEEDRERLGAVLVSFRAGSVGNDLEFRVRRRDGAVRWLAMSWQPARNARGEVLGQRTSVRDIDDRKQLELGLADALRRAERADRAKSEFLAMMSHELRTPLHCISGYSELIAQGELSADARRFLEVITKQSRDMLRLVDDLLEMSALQGQDLRPVYAPTDLAAVTAEVVHALRPLAEERMLTLSLVAPTAGTVVRTDAQRVAQIVSNLVGNGIKFTQRGSVTATYQERPLDDIHLEVRISVRDTGIGMEPAKLGRVFEPFTQLESAVRRQHGGVGLGLAIAQRLARALGGELRVQSKLHHGSTFELVLPVVREQSALAPSRGAAEGGTSRVDPGFAQRHPQSILVMDDVFASRELLRELLGLYGYRPVVVASGVEGLEAARKRPFDLAIVDYHMPVLDGPTVARALRRQHSQLRIVALSADVLSKQQLALAGFDEVWTKPLSLEALRDLLLGAAPRDRSAEPLAELLERRVVDDLKATTGLDGTPLFQRVARRVLDGAEELREALATALQEQQYARIVELAHALKGHLLMVGARPAAQAAERLEEVCARGEPQPANLAHAALVELLGQTLAALRAQLR